MAATRGLKGPASRYRWRRETAELGLVALAFLLYFVVRANVVDRLDLALANARLLVDAEAAVGGFVEREMQQVALGSEVAVRFFNFVYFWLDFPLIAVVGLLMYFRRRSEYTFTRDAILFSGAAALVSYMLFPVAPPRLLPEAQIIDTLHVYDNLSYQAQSTSFFVNPYAAMPSLHVGWSILLAIGVRRAFPGNKVVLLLALLHPLTQSLSTVVTGNHYLLDGAGGVAAAAVGLAFAAGMQRFGYGWLRRNWVRFEVRARRGGAHTASLRETARRA
jgi:hypothetical protein